MMKMLSPQDYIQLLAIVATIVISLISGIYVVVTNTKKYELSEAYSKELLDWHFEVIELMISIIHMLEADKWYDDSCNEIKLEKISKLSFMIEKGRFYFPNKSTNGKEKKLPPYQGIRDASVEIIATFYEVVKKDDAIKYVDILWDLERQFNARGYEIINPRKRIANTTKYTYVKSKKKESYNDYRDKTSGQF